MVKKIEINVVGIAIGYRIWITQMDTVPSVKGITGQIWDVLDDLVATGIQGFHPVEKAAGMDLKIVK